MLAVVGAVIDGFSDLVLETAYQFNLKSSGTFLSLFCKFIAYRLMCIVGLVGFLIFRVLIYTRGDFLKLALLSEELKSFFTREKQ